MKTALIVAGLIIIGAVGYYTFVMAPGATSNTDSPTSLGTPAPGNEGNYPEPQGKLNIDVICNGALAYMSFPSGVEAEAWVEACKRGEHPEAIDQWKQMNGITDDRTI
jgi:hypothetical protein